ncbi:MAG TPA: helix-turn-helix domain-containing protein [Candidatus Scybalousia intestinigallinarum]|nr:helix-turn-helix domain-containing protein [Candidatus Scybalousia intestinigallinarum]
MNQIIIGRFIAELRKNKGLTQQELAQKLYVDRTTVSKWEVGKIVLV